MKRKKLKINLLFEIKKLRLAVPKFLKVNMNFSWFNKTDNTFWSSGCAKMNQTTYSMVLKGTVINSEHWMFLEISDILSTQVP